MDHIQTNDVVIKSGEARATAGMLSFLAALINQPPDRDLVCRLRTVCQSDLYDQTTDLLNHSYVGPNGLSEIREFISRTAHEPEVSVEQTLARDWTRLFRGVSINQKIPPPYEALYIDDTNSDIEILSELSHTYAVNGVEIAANNPNRPDFLGIEIDFLRLLAEREWAAWEKGDEALANKEVQRIRDFMIGHPSRWIDRYLEVAITHANTLLYRGLFKLIQYVINLMDVRLSLTTHPGS